MNILGVIVSTVAVFLFGWLWHSPVLCGNVWMKEMGFSKKNIKDMKISPAISMGLSVIVTIITAIVVDYIISTTDMHGALIFALLIWLAFLMPFSLEKVLWENKSVTLFIISGGYKLFSLLIMVIILKLI